MIPSRPVAPEPDDFDDGSDDGESGDCYWCCGEGWVECDDPIECTKFHDELGQCRCSSCGGSGLAQDMTIW